MNRPAPTIRPAPLMAAVVLAASLLGCVPLTQEDVGGGGDYEAPPEVAPVESAAAAEEVDELAVSACERFQLIANDAGLGILTDEELRERVQQFRTIALGVDDPEFRAMATRMLAAVTADDSRAVGAEVDNVAAYCDAL